MRSRFWIILALLVVVPGLLMTVGCQKKTVVEQTGQAPAPAPAPKEKPAPAPAPDKMADMVMREHIHFGFDQYYLTPVAQELLRRQAEWLRANSDVTATIEGHCDERGTPEYNLALGDRRAESVKSFLVDLGIAEKRLATISYGEERPLDPRSNEEAWAKNRRAQFVLN